MILDGPASGLAAIGTLVPGIATRLSHGMLLRNG